MKTADELKKLVADAALNYIPAQSIVGIGSGSTVLLFIAGLKNIKHKIEGAVASSIASEQALKAVGIPVLSLNEVNDIPVYVDGADEFNAHHYLVKGGGGALTREKIVATASKQFICIVDERKQVDVLGAFPVAVEVLPMARSFVARELVKMGGNPVYRTGFTTDNGNVILDVHHLDLSDPLLQESKINQIPGVVCNGIFAQRKADIILCANGDGTIHTYK